MGSVPTAVAGTIDANGVRSGVFESTIAVNRSYVTKLEFVNMHVPMVDNPGTGAHAALEVYDFQKCLLEFKGASADLDITKSSAGVNADWDGDIGLGTVAADTGATLSSTEQDLCPTTSTPQAVAGATTGDMLSTSTEAPKLFDGTGTAKKVFLNVLVDDADQDVTSTPCDLIFNGTIEIHWEDEGTK